MEIAGQYLKTQQHARWKVRTDHMALTLVPVAGALT
jgi:hypothetical protein